MRTVVTVISGLLLTAAACGGTDDPAITLTALTPNHAYADAPLAAALRGGPFRPAFSLDTSSGTARIDTTAFDCSVLPASAASGVTTASALSITGWSDPTQLNVSVPAGLDAGAYDVHLRDPSGRTSILKMGFSSLGPDRDAPDVSLDSPPGGTFVVAGTRLRVIVSANDGEGRLAALSWMLTSPHFPAQTHSCPPPQGAALVHCSDGEIVLPETTSLEDPLILRIDAQDAAGNLGSREDLLFLAQAPVISSFVPVAGPATGMTQIVVRGQSFVRASRVLIDGVPITPAGGVFENETTIRGFTNAHDPGLVAVVVETGNVQVMGNNFQFVATPVIRRVTPDQGPSQGGTTVTIVGSHFVCNRPDVVGTQFSVGADLVRVPVTVTGCDGTNRVVATMPPYVFPPDGTATVSLFALDPVAGESELPDAFTYTPLLAPPPPLPPNP